MFRFLAVSLASGLALAAVAHAQDADDDGMDCVYNELVDSYELVAEALLYGDLGAEELAKSKQAVEAATARCDARYSYSADQAEVAAELGDVLFAVANLARHCKVDPEVALRATNDKFENRYFDGGEYNS